MTRDCDVIVVGAGVAGLAAAAAIRAAGRSCVVLEAASRIGGRAFTETPPALGDQPFDHGASWLHDADHNPLTPIARAHGYTLIDSGTVRIEHTQVDGRLASAARLRDFSQTETRLAGALDRLVAAGGPDRSYAQGLDHVATPDDEFWLPTIEGWEAPIIAAADAGSLSLLDWHRNRLDGRNLLVAGGLGAFVSACLGAMAGPVRLATPVSRIDWGGRDVAAETPAGIVRAGACIVTVSTGVLRSGGIAFDPRLPGPLEAAIAGLPMGLATKVALRVRDVHRLGLSPHTVVDRRLTRRGEAMMIFSVRPQGFDYVTGYCGGATARALAHDGPQAAIAFAREEWRRLFGATADDVFVEGEAIATGWDSDPWQRGAYCYARPGHAEARQVLGAGLAGPRLQFAGEAMHSTHGGTVGGAFETGRRAAAAVLSA